jgi:hypothetical protein
VAEREAVYPVREAERGGPLLSSEVVNRHVLSMRNQELGLEWHEVLVDVKVIHDAVVAECGPLLLANLLQHRSC